MSHQNVETVSRAAERTKLGLAVLVLVAGIVAYSALVDQPGYVRVGAFIAGLIVAAVIVWFSDTGRRTFAFVVVMGILLWIADKLLGWIIYGLLLGWN